MVCTLANVGTRPTRSPESQEINDHLEFLDSEFHQNDTHLTLLRPANIHIEIGKDTASFILNLLSYQAIQNTANQNTEIPLYILYGITPNLLIVRCNLIPAEIL